MAKSQDYLPEAERFIPFSQDDAILIFGKILSEEFPNYLDPTDTLPGSEARIEVYRTRALRREPIFHPEDRVSFEGVTIGRPATKNPIVSILAKLKVNKR